MPIEIGALLFAAVKKTVFAAISKRVIYAGESFLTKRKIEGRVDDSIAQVVEQLIPFFESEHITKHQQELLIITCSDELSDILREPEEVFAASLDGQRIFDRRYEDGQLPEAIRDERLGDLYALIFPQVANLVCAYPPAVEQWKIEGYKDGFRRLDEIATTLGNVANKLDYLASRDGDTADALLGRVRQSLTQRVEFQLDLTGLRGDRPDAVPLEKCFIIPELLRRKQERESESRGEIHAATESDILDTFGGTSNRSIIIGSPGAGKSTWSRWLQRKLLTNSKPHLAVFVRLRDLVKSDLLPSHLNLVRDAAGTHLREEVDSTAVRRWCKDGLLTFILDGFDEIPPIQRDAVLSWVQELVRAIEPASLIITSRPVTTSHLDELPKTWLHWEILPFDEGRITEYISRWYAFAPVLSEKTRAVDAEALAQRWLNDFAVRPLVGTPLMLATILMVHHMDGELPRGRSKLYERYVSGMLGLWDSRWGVPSAIEISPDVKMRLLTQLALNFHSNEVDQLGDEEVERFVASILSSLGCSYTASVVLDHLRERTGLLIGPGTWSFVHKNVGEFLVGAAIHDGDHVDEFGQKFDRLRLFKERHNDRWNAVLFFWAGLTSPGDLQSFIEQVAAESEDKDFLLAFGLIHDQLQPHRLAEPWRSNQLSKLLMRGVKESGHDSFYSCSPQLEDFQPVEVPRQTIRGLEESDLDQALSECLKVSTLTWDQVSKCDESLLFLTWLFFVTGVRNADDIRAAMASEPDLPRNWYYFPFSWGVDRAFRMEISVNLNSYVACLCDSAPQHAGKMVFFLMGNFVYEFHARSGWGREIDSKYVQILVQTINENKDREIDKEWLGLTGRFVWDPGARERFDLLDAFQDQLHVAVQEGLLSENPVVASVRGFVSDLQRDRVGIS
jgi:hypothetical protein